jgi:uncharacterized protein YggE
MKRILFLLILSLCFGSFAFAQDIDKMPAITVTGTAEVQVAPDEVVFTLDVAKTDKDLQIAKRLNDESVSKILELARRFSVLPQNIQTDSISVEMKYQIVRDPKVRVFDEDGDETGKRIFLGYEVSKAITVKLTDLSRFEDFFSEVLKTGITEVRNVSFETSKYRENRVQAREMAMRVAREKAVSMAAAINQTIGKAILIQEGIPTGTGGFASANRARSNNFSAGSESLQSISTTFAPGAIKVEASVTVSFLLN